MTNPLKQVMSKVEMLPDHHQDTIAEAIQRELEELEWDTIVSTQIPSASSMNRPPKPAASTPQG